MVQVYTWGKGYCGALGHGDEIEKTTPELLTSLKNELAVQVLLYSHILGQFLLRSMVYSICNFIFLDQVLVVMMRLDTACIVLSYS